MHCQYMCSKLKTKIKLLMSYNWVAMVVISTSLRFLIAHGKN